MFFAAHQLDEPALCGWVLPDQTYSRLSDIDFFKQLGMLETNPQWVAEMGDSWRSFSVLHRAYCPSSPHRVRTVPRSSGGRGAAQ